MIICGVPQSFILGAILFLLYINVIKNSSKILIFFLFADDTSAYSSGKNLNEIQETYNQELEKVLTWLKANNLTLSTDKSNFVLFHGPKRKMENNTDIKINGTKIKKKEYTKYLGVSIDNRVSCVHHIRHANLKVSKGIGILTKLRQFVSKKCVKIFILCFCATICRL